MTNSAPIAQAISAISPENGSVVTVTASYTDLDANDTHTFSVDTTGTLGTVINNNDGTFSYDPNGLFESLAAGETATDTFTYTVDDGNGGTSTETVTVTITGQNDAPVALETSVSLTQNTLSTVFTPDFSDLDISDTHTVTFDFGGGGSVSATMTPVTDNGDGTYTYTAQDTYDYLLAGETATETFSYTVTDNLGASSTNTVTVTIMGTNHAPVALETSVSLTQNTLSTVFTPDFSDLDMSDTHTVTFDFGGGGSVSATMTPVTDNGDGTYTYIAQDTYEYLAAGETATETFSYTVTDNLGASSTNTVTVTITGTNDAPVATALSGTVSEDGPGLTVMASYTDLDASDMHTFSVDTTGTLGTVINNNDGTFSYDPNGLFESLAAGETATDTFTYTVDDGNGGTTTETVTVTITGQNDAPVALETSVSLTQNMLSTVFTPDFSDLDMSDTHTVTFDFGGGGSVSATMTPVTDNGDGTYTYIAQDTYEYLAAGETATETFSYTVTDNLGASSTNTVTVTITGTNDAPVATALSGTVSEDGPGLTVMASYTDLDASDMHTFSVDTTGTLGTVINNNDGTFSYDPNGQFESLATGETATDTFTYTVDDGNGGTTTETVTVTITGQNDAPDLTPLTAIAQEDGPSITVSANFTDVDSDGPFVISIDTSSTVGSVTDNGDGTFTYHANGQFEYLNAGETATDTFTYTVSDEDGGSSTETITVTVEGQVEPTKFTASDGAFADYFGASTAINDHGVVLVGAPLNDDPGANSGYIYLYRPDGSGGYSEQILNASIPIAGVQYGYSVALNNSEVAVVGSFDRNQVHVYQPDGNGGHFETKLLPAGTLYSDLFGHSVAINESGVIAVGAIGDDDKAANAGAVYVYTPDDFGGYDEVKLTASDGLAQDNFGYSVVVGDGGHVVVGAYNDDGVEVNQGAVYVFTPNGSGGYTQTKLTASDADETDQFGHASAVNASGTVVVGVPLADVGGITNSGAIYVYEPDGSGGYAETRIVALDVYPDDRFGYSLDINDNGTIVAGAYNNDDAGANSGSAYVFVPDGAGGYTQYKLTAPDAAAADKFGISVSINSDGVVSIGAQAGDGAVADTGAVYTFVPNGDGDYVGYDGTIYTGVPLDGSASNPVTPDSITANKFTASDGAFADYFGASTAINDHGVVLVGAPLNDDPGANSGYIYLYRPDGSGGYSEQILNASIPIAGVQYGYSVALNNSEVAVVGSFDRNQVHVYQPDGNGGHFETKLLPAGTLYSDLFGHSVAINESGVIAVGAIGDDDKAANAGAVYVYTPDDFGGYDEVKLTASDGLAQDNFGYSVVVGDGGHVVVGAYNDDGVEVNQGAVYVFTPNGSGGYTQTKLTASDADETDQFGHASAVNASGTVVVGVPLADVGGITNSGAIYVYEPDGSGGYAETRIVALDVYPDDRFGYSLDINDNGTIVAGAYNNDDAGANSGSAYVFVPDGAGGYTQYKLTAPDAAAADKFGISVSINSDGVVSIGAQAGDGTVADTGAVYTFVPNGDGDYVGYDGTVYGGVASAGLNINGTGVDNSLIGGASDDTISGFAGNDTIAGASGDDVLSGGSGNDTFVFRDGDTGHDTISGFTAGAGVGDVLEFETTIFNDYASVLAAAADVGGDVVITVDANTSVKLEGVTTASLHQDDFQFV